MDRAPSIVPALLLAVLAASAGACKREQSQPRADGTALFASTCARCHGADGSGGPSAAPGQPAPRDLREPALQSGRSDDELFTVIKAGKGTAMPGFGGVYDDGQIRALVAHVRKLGGR